MDDAPRTVDGFMKVRDAFRSFIVARGSEVLALTNPYEVERFTTPDGVGVIYKDKSGRLSWVGGAKEAFSAYASGATWRAVAKGKRLLSGRSGAVIRAILERDGSDCFYCGKPLGDDMTKEHMFSVTQGGTSHIGNLVLAHDRCNKDVGHLSVAEKCRVAMAARAKLECAA